MNANKNSSTIPDLIFKEEVYQIVGAAMVVYNELGSGFLESVYQEAMEIECTKSSLPFVCQKRIRIAYKDTILQKEFIADMVFFDKIIVELKALDRISGKEESQLLNYLKATHYKVGVILNFGAHRKLEWSRYVF